MDTERVPGRGVAERKGKHHAALPTPGPSLHVTPNQIVPEPQSPRVNSDKHPNLAGGSEDDFTPLYDSDNLTHTKGMLYRYACPYYKNDPKKYLSCAEWNSTSLLRVKEHIKGFHLKPIRCPRCNVYRAGDIFQMRNHSRDGRCQEATISTPVESDVLKKANALRQWSLSWEQIYQILFPDCTESEVPYPYWLIKAPNTITRHQCTECVGRARGEENTGNRELSNNYTPHIDVSFNTPSAGNTGAPKWKDKEDISPENRIDGYTAKKTNKGTKDSDSQKLTTQSDTVSSKPILRKEPLPTVLDSIDGSGNQDEDDDEDEDDGEDDGEGEEDQDDGEDEDQDDNLEYGDDEMETSSNDENPYCILGAPDNRADTGNIWGHSGGGKEGPGGKDKDGILRKRAVGQSFTNKPKRGSQDDDDENFDPPSKRKKKDGEGKGKSPEQHKKPFACPYFKKNPLKYSHCAEWCSTKIYQVKVHCKTDHLRPFCCGRCGEFRAGNHDEITKHLVDGDCEKSGLFDPEVYSAREKSDDIDKAKTWQRIYEILFPLYIPDQFLQNQIDVLMAPIDNDELSFTDRVRAAVSLNERPYRLGLAEFLRDRLGPGSVSELLSEYDKDWVSKGCSQAPLPEDDDSGIDHGTGARDPPAGQTSAQQVSDSAPSNSPATLQDNPLELLDGSSDRDPGNNHCGHGITGDLPTQPHEDLHSTKAPISDENLHDSQNNPWDPLQPQNQEPQQAQHGQESSANGPQLEYGNISSNMGSKDYPNVFDFLNTLDPAGGGFY